MHVDKSRSNFILTGRGIARGGPFGGLSPLI